MYHQSSYRSAWYARDEDIFFFVQGEIPFEVTFSFPSEGETVEKGSIGDAKLIPVDGWNKWVEAHGVYLKLGLVNPEDCGKEVYTISAYTISAPNSPESTPLTGRSTIILDG